MVINRQTMALCNGTDDDAKIAVAMKDCNPFCFFLVIADSDINLTIYVVRRHRLRRVPQPVLLVDANGIVGCPVTVELDALDRAKYAAHLFGGDPLAAQWAGYNEVDISVIFLLWFLRRDLNDREKGQEQGLEASLESDVERCRKPGQ